MLSLFPNIMLTFNVLMLVLRDIKHLRQKKQKQKQKPITQRPVCLLFQ